MPHSTRRTFLVAVAILCLAAAKDDALDRYGYTAADLEAASFENISGDTFFLPEITDILRSLPVESRADAVLVLGKAARAYVESKAFKDRWAEAVKTNVPPQAPVKGNTAGMMKTQRDTLAKQRDTLAKKNAQIQQALKAMSPEQRAQVEAAMKQMKQAMAAQEEAASQSAANEPQEAARYERDLEAYNKAKARWPKEPKARVRAALERFLSITADVDFDATLVEKYGLRRFENEVYERKSDQWKMAFRLGKEGTTAARKFAQEWLKALR